MGPRAGLDTEVRGKILCPRRGSNPDRPYLNTYKNIKDLKLLRPLNTNMFCQVISRVRVVFVS
jgi:hypothetical protein